MKLSVKDKVLGSVFMVEMCINVALKKIVCISSKKPHLAIYTKSTCSKSHA